MCQAFKGLAWSKTWPLASFFSLFGPPERRCTQFGSLGGQLRCASIFLLAGQFCEPALAFGLRFGFTARLFCRLTRQFGCLTLRLGLGLQFRDKTFKASCLCREFSRLALLFDESLTGPTLKCASLFNEQLKPGLFVALRQTGVVKAGAFRGKGGAHCVQFTQIIQQDGSLRAHFRDDRRKKNGRTDR